MLGMDGRVGTPRSRQEPGYLPVASVVQVYVLSLLWMTITCRRKSTCRVTNPPSGPGCMTSDVALIATLAMNASNL